MILWYTAFFTLLADQVTKMVVLKYMHEGQSIIGIPGVLSWTLVYNTHGAYGLFGDQTWFLTLISFTAFVIIWFAFRKKAQENDMIALALGLVLGGAIGNILDRIARGFVVDFIHIAVWPFTYFEVFNVADSFITIGVLLLILLTLNTPVKIDREI